MNKKTHTRVWIWAVLIMGLIPMIARFLVYLSGHTSHGFEMCEYVFFGLTMCITNITAVGNLELAERFLINICSMALAVFLGIILALSIIETNVEGKCSVNTLSYIFNIVAFLCVSFAVWYSYGINTKVFLYEEKRRKQERRIGQKK